MRPRPDGSDSLPGSNSVDIARTGLGPDREGAPVMGTEDAEFLAKCRIDGPPERMTQRGPRRGHARGRTVPVTRRLSELQGDPLDHSVHRAAGRTSEKRGSRRSAIV